MHVNRVWDFYLKPLYTPSATAFIGLIWCLIKIWEQPVRSLNVWVNVFGGEYVKILILMLYLVALVMIGCNKV